MRGEKESKKKVFVNLIENNLPKRIGQEIIKEYKKYREEIVEAENVIIKIITGHK